MSAPKLVVIMVLIGIFGCSYGKENMELILDNPPGFLEDSLYVDTQERLEDLEGRYLRKEISYAEYLEKKAGLEGRYKQEADRRSMIIEGNE